LLYGRKTKNVGHRSGAGALVSLGSIRHMAGGNYSARPCLLHGRWADRSGRSEYFESDGDCDWIGFAGGRLGDLRFGGKVGARKITRGVRGIWTGDDSGGSVGIDARA